MSDYQVDHEKSETSSRLGGATATAPMLLDLAPELISRIAFLLDIKDLLAFRRCHSLLFGISQDKLLWRHVLRNLRPPLPRALRSSSLDDLSHDDLEEVVQDSYMTERRWLKRREACLRLPRRGGQSNPTTLLDFLDDRWIICVPTRGLPTIWDTQQDPPKLCGFHESASLLFQTDIVDADAAVDPQQGDIIIWLRKDPVEPFSPQVLRIHLADPNTDSLQLTAYQTVGHFDIRVYALEPSRCLAVAMTAERHLHVGNWNHDRMARIDAYVPENDDDGFGVFLGIRIVGDHIVIFRNKCVDLVSIPPFPNADGRAYEPNPTFHRFHLNYLGAAFGGVGLSEPQPNPESPDDSLIVYAFAYQRNIACYFRITVYNPNRASSGPRVRMDLSLLGVYKSRDQAEIWACWVPSAVLLGAEGKRAVWAERSRASMRMIFVASLNSSCSGAVALQSGDDLRKLCRIAPRIKSTGDIFKIGPLASDDDIAWCAFSEATGRIVLTTFGERIIYL